MEEGFAELNQQICIVKNARINHVAWSKVSGFVPRLFRLLSLLIVFPYDKMFV